MNKITGNTELPWLNSPARCIYLVGTLQGPVQNLDARLTSTGAYKEWSKPVDRVDNAASHHDLAYQHFPDTATRNIADLMLLDEMNAI